MKTQKRTAMVGILAAFAITLVAIAVLSLTGCEQPIDPPPVIPPGTITYTATQDGGVNGTTTSTGIKFTFSASVDSLTAANITVSGAASKGSGALTGSGTNWTLPITVTSAGLATVSISKSGIEAAQKSVTVYKAGQASPEYWSITWNMNGGEKGTGAYPEQIVKGAVLAKPSPDPTKAGNTFGGWYTNSGLTQTYSFSSPVTDNLALYAKWETGSQPAQYWSITWNMNGGEKGAGAYPEQIVKGTALAKPTPDPTKAGNTFGGWYSDSGLTQTYNFASAVTTNLNLYAKWEAVSAHVHQWGAWTATGITGTEQTVCATNPAHIEHRLTGTDRFTFELISGNAAFSVRKGTVTTGEVRIPAYYRPDTNSPYLLVTEIGSASDNTSTGAFIGCTDITGIIIPDSVTSIGGGAFIFDTSGSGGTPVLMNLATVTFSENSQLQTIGVYAFYKCSSLTNITIPASVTTIGYYAFAECTSLTGINIPAGVTAIDIGTFSNCTSLASINIPASVTSIGEGAFLGCVSLTSITVNAGNPNYLSEGNILYNKAKTLVIAAAPAGISGNVTIPASVTEIGLGAFAGCTGLTGINIPAGVTSIGGGAFAGWTSSQIINVAGFASQSAADSAWGQNWRVGCNAVINYLLPATGDELDGTTWGLTTNGGWSYVITFNSPNVIWINYWEGQQVEAETYTGTYSISGSTVTLLLDGMVGPTTATLSGNTLLFPGDTIYTKQ